MIKRWMIGMMWLAAACKKPPSKPLVSNAYDTQITEKYWKLVSIPDFTLQAGFTREPHMVLRSNANTFKGNGGCNAIAGFYKMQNKNSIQFLKIISTEIKCPALETEQLFIKILESANQFSQNMDTLVLMHDHQLLARFEAVYL